MGSVFPLYGMVLGILLAVFLLLMLRRDESISRKWAKIRVRVDDRSRQPMREHPEEEFEMGTALDWFILGLVLILIFMLMRFA